MFLYFHSAMKGTKLDLIARDSRAAFEMDCGRQLVLCQEDMNCTMTYASVMGRGTIEVLPEEEKIPAQITEQQSLNIDAVTGATNTSKAILAAVEDCVNQAGGDAQALLTKEAVKSKEVMTRNWLQRSL